MFETQLKGFLKKAIFLSIVLTAIPSAYVVPEYSKGGNYGVQSAYAESVSQTQHNINAFRKAGWDIYENTKSRKPLKAFTWRYGTRTKEIISAWKKNSLGIRNYLSNIAPNFQLLVDGKVENDEIKAMSVSMDDDLLINVYSGDPDIGILHKGKKLYAMKKKFSRQVANNFRRLSPNIKTHPLSMYNLD